MNSEDYSTLVKDLKIKPGYISNVEDNRTIMPLRVLTYYARSAGCSSDSLVSELEPECSETTLDRELYQLITKLDTDTKEKLLKTLEI